MDQMQTPLPPYILLRLRDPSNPILRLAFPAPEAREVEHAAVEAEQLVFGDSAGVLLVVRGVSVDPMGFLGDLPDSRTAELDEVDVLARVHGAVA